MLGTCGKCADGVCSRAMNGDGSMGIIGSLGGCIDLIGGSMHNSSPEEGRLGIDSEKLTWGSALGDLFSSNTGAYRVPALSIDTSLSRAISSDSVSLRVQPQENAQSVPPLYAVVVWVEGLTGNLAAMCAHNLSKVKGIQIFTGQTGVRRCKMSRTF